MATLASNNKLLTTATTSAFANAASGPSSRGVSISTYSSATPQQANNSSSNSSSTPFKLNWMQWSEHGDHWDIVDSKMTYCDVTIACSDGQLMAHSSILALDSFFVKNLLKDATPGALGGPAGVVVHLPDFSRGVVRQLLSILYNGCAYVNTASDSAKVSRLGRILGYNVHKWQLVPNTNPSSEQSTTPPQVPSPIRNLAPSGTTISVLKRPPPSLHPVGSFAAQQGVKLTKFFSEKTQQLNNRNSSSSSNNGLETLAETSSVTISRISCVSTNNHGQPHHGNNKSCQQKTNSSTSAGCQTVNSAPVKDPLSLTPTGSSSHPQVPTIRVKQGLKIASAGMVNQLENDSMVTLTPTSSTPPGLCKISPATSTANMGQTGGAKTLQDILSSSGRVLTVRNVTTSGAGSTQPTRILVPSVVNKSTMISDGGARCIAPKPAPGKTVQAGSMPPPLILAQNMPPPLLVQTRASAAQQKQQVSVKQQNQLQRAVPEDEEEELSLDSMLDCMIKEEGLDDEDLLDDLEEEEEPAGSTAGQKEPPKSKVETVPVPLKLPTSLGSADEPPALIVHPPVPGMTKITWHHSDPSGWKGKDGQKDLPAGASSSAAAEQEQTKSPAKKRGRKRRRLSRKRRTTPIKITIKPLKGEGGGAEEDKAEEDGAEDGEEDEEEEPESESEQGLDNDDSDEDWELSSANAGSNKKKKKPNRGRRSPRLSVKSAAKDAANKESDNKDAPAAAEKEPDAEDMLMEEEAAGASDAEVFENDEEINLNIPKIAIGAIYDSFKDFQVAFQRYCAENLACMKMIRRHLLQGHGDKFPVHEITYSCGSIKRKRGENNPAQCCPAMLHCKFNATWKKYVIAKLETNHANHPVTRESYDVYIQKKELTSHEKKVALRLLGSGKDPETVCKIMNRVTGKTISVEYLTGLTV